MGREGGNFNICKIGEDSFFFQIIFDLWEIIWPILADSKQYAWFEYEFDILYGLGNASRTLLVFIPSFMFFNGLTKMDAVWANRLVQCGVWSRYFIHPLFDFESKKPHNSWRLHFWAIGDVTNHRLALILTWLTLGPCFECMSSSRRGGPAVLMKEARFMIRTTIWWPLPSRASLCFYEQLFSNNQGWRTPTCTCWKQTDSSRKVNHGGFLHFFITFIYGS